MKRTGDSSMTPHIHYFDECSAQHHPGHHYTLPIHRPTLAHRTIARQRLLISIGVNNSLSTLLFSMSYSVLSLLCPRSIKSISAATKHWLLWCESIIFTRRIIWVARNNNTLTHALSLSLPPFLRGSDVFDLFNIIRHEWHSLVRLF